MTVRHAQGAPVTSLAGLHRWATAPARWAGGLGACLAAGYGVVELRFPPGTFSSFAWIAGSIALVAALIGDWTDQRGLATVKQVATGGLSDPRLAKQAVREAFAIPDRAFRVIALSWILGASVAGAALATLGGVPWGLSLRVASVGFLFGPLTAALAHVLLLPRSRKAVQRIAEGRLSAEDVVDAVPPRRRQTRARLVLLAAITVLTPSVLIADFALTRLDAPSEGQRARTFGEAGLALYTFALVVAAGWASGAALEAPMKEISEEARRIAGGDLTGLKVVPAEDELWAAAAAFSAMHAHLVRVLSQLERATVHISSTAEQIVQMSSKHQAGSQEQSAALHETMSTTEELARSGRQIATNAASVAAIAEQTLAAARDGQRNAEIFARSMGQLRQDNQAIADSVVKLNKRVQQIGKIIEFIDGIADKSDLLALNAELEGTKAGDVGRGFSLVAAEMRRVAENVLASTQQIGRLIEDIRDATNAAVMATEAGVKATDVGAAYSSELSEKLKAILDMATQTSDSVRAISLATQQQKAGTDQLAVAMANVLQVTQQGAAATGELNSANASLSTLSLDLKRVIDRFKLA